MKKRERYRRNAIQIALQQGIQLDPDDWEQIWSIIGEHKEPVYLYAIVDEEKGVVKFGRSKNPGQRFKAIRTGNCANIKLAAYCLHHTPYTEREVHTRLSGGKIYGEWFTLGPVARALISGMRCSSGVRSDGDDRAYVAAHNQV